MSHLVRILVVMFSALLTIGFMMVTIGYQERTGKLRYWTFTCGIVCGCITLGFMLDYMMP